MGEEGEGNEDVYERLMIGYNDIGFVFIYLLAARDGDLPWRKYPNI